MKIIQFRRSFDCPFVSSIDAKSTLFAVFEICHGTGNVHDESIGECVTKLLGIIPDAAKIVIIAGSHLNQVGEISEALHVMYRTRSDAFVSSVLEVLSKRWKTLDLVSMMQEVQRNVNFKKNRWYWEETKYMVEIKDTLSNIPRLQKTEES